MVKYCAFQSDALPKVVDNDYDFGYVHSDWFGSQIKITCSVGLGTFIANTKIFYVHVFV